jgi:hypothetical protein
MISFASQAERCYPFQLCTALDRQQTVSEGAVDFHPEISIACRQSELQASSKPSQDCQDLHLREYTHLDPSSNGQVAENVRTVWEMVDWVQTLVVVWALMVESWAVEEGQSLVMIFACRTRYGRLA